MAACRETQPTIRAFCRDRRVIGQSVSTPAARIELVQESAVQFWFASLVSLPMGRLRSGKSGPLLPLVSESRAAWEALGRLSLAPASIGTGPSPTRTSTAGGGTHHEPSAGFASCWSTPRRPSVGRAAQGNGRRRQKSRRLPPTVAENVVHPSFTKVPLTSAGEKGNIVGLQAEW